MDHAKGFKLPPPSFGDNKSFQDANIIFAIGSRSADTPVMCALLINEGLVAIVFNAILPPRENAMISNCLHSSNTIVTIRSKSSAWKFKPTSP